MKRIHWALLTSLGIAAIAIGSVWLYLAQPKSVVVTDEKAPLLCWPADQIHTFEIHDSTGKRRFKRHQETWVSEDARPIDTPKLEVQLAQLRQAVFKSVPDLKIEHSGVKESQVRWVFKTETEQCIIELGLVNQVTGQRLIRRQAKSVLLGSVDQKTLLRIDWDLAADRLKYLDQGSMTSIALAPEIAKQMMFQRHRGHWRFKQEEIEMIADEEAMKELLQVLTKGLIGTWLESPPELTEPDLTATISLGRKIQKISYFHHESGYLAADETGVIFRLNQNPLPILRRSLDAYRDRQIVRYQRGQVDHFILISQAGRFRYDRQPQDKGPDRWFEGKRELKDGYRLAALQWDIHTLRAKSYLAPASSQNRVCLETCRQVQAVDLDGEITVDLKLWPQGEDYEAMQKKGDLFLVHGKDVDHWPFQAVP